MTVVVAQDIQPRNVAGACLLAARGDKAHHMQTLRMSAPAKINVYLRITGRRADGYHLLDSLMIPIGLSDEITVQIEEGSSGISLVCDDPSLPIDDANLAYRAAALLSREADIDGHITIVLHKRIPAGAGLGGGSSDAAAVLKSLNTLLSLNISEDRLCRYGAQLGADVPFFIACRPARVEGIGDILTPVAPLPHRWIVLVVPPFGVSTPWAYHQFDALPPPLPSIPPPFSARVSEWPSREQLINDLERAVFPTYPRIAATKSALLAYKAEGALMSGSGSSVFGIFQTRRLAEQARDNLQEYGQAFLLEPLSLSPSSS
jgi:4-diphosphocytidyl-2-C-methyl-D-erythritol kinase